MGVGDVEKILCLNVCYLGLSNIIHVYAYYRYLNRISFMRKIFICALWALSAMALHESTHSHQDTQHEPSQESNDQQGQGNSNAENENNGESTTFTIEDQRSEDEMRKEALLELFTSFDTNKDQITSVQQILKSLKEEVGEDNAQAYFEENIKPLLPIYDIDDNGLTFEEFHALAMDQVKSYEAKEAAEREKGERQKKQMQAEAKQEEEKVVEL